MYKCFLWLLLGAISGLAQTSVPEVSAQQDDSVVFKSRVTLVAVPVIVRDKSGKPVGTLRQEDFQLFDKGKPQVISKFSVEKSGGVAIARTPVTAGGRMPEQSAAPEVIAPDHFVGLLFDDIHMSAADVVAARTAAQTFVGSGLGPADRAAIFTTSGQTTLDFTGDRDALNNTLLKLSARPIANDPTEVCPFISFYMADQIVNKGDQQALNLAIALVIACMHPPDRDTARIMALANARSTLEMGEHETQVTIFSVTDVVRRMSRMPGQRTVLLASPGFLRTVDQDAGQVIDLAAQSGVVINALDVRGLYTPTTADSSRQGFEVSIKQGVDKTAAILQSGVLAEFAAGTGGTFIENTNDLKRGFRELGAPPEVYYVLGFSPQNLKIDGAYHSLKVSLKTATGFSVKARLGYYAPRHLSNADEEAKDEISQAVFSHDEIGSIPIDMSTQFFKTSESEARLTIMSRLDAAKLHFRKADGRNVDDVAIVCALFDRNGNYLQGVSKTLQLRLLDDTLRNGMGEGVSVPMDFKVAPGTYVIRLVARDSEGQAMAARNGAVDIP
jgi:VWFA-related protein